MLEEPRLLLPRALDPLYPLEPPPKASRLPEPLRETSRLPMLSAPPPLDPLPNPELPARLLAPAPDARLLTPAPPAPPPASRVLGKFPP